MESNARCDVVDAEFKAGDRIAGQVDGADVEGEIVSLDDAKAKVRTEWGTLTVDLATAKIKPTLDWYKTQVGEAIGEEDGTTHDAGLILIIAAVDTGPFVDKVVAFTGLREVFVKKVLWRADIYDIFNDIKWHQLDDGSIWFIMDALVAEGLADRRKRKNVDDDHVTANEEWEYEMLGTTGIDSGHHIVDGRLLVQRECTAIQSKYELNRREAWKFWREMIIDIDSVTFDFSEDDPLGLNSREEAETATPA